MVTSRRTFCAAAAGSGLLCRWRAMFSMTTTVSSMMRPMATARPPSDIRLSVSPLQCRNRKVIARVVGMARAEISVARQLRRKASKDQDAEQAADEDGVADVVHGRVDESGLIVDDRGLDVARQRLA